MHTSQGSSARKRSGIIIITIIVEFILKGKNGIPFCTYISCIFVYMYI